MILSKIRLCINYSSKQHPSILQVPCECKNTLTTHLQLTYTTLETSQQQHKKAVLSLYSYTDYWFNSELIIQANLVILYVLYKLFLHYWIFFRSPSLSEGT